MLEPGAPAHGMLLAFIGGAPPETLGLLNRLRARFAFAPCVERWIEQQHRLEHGTTGSGVELTVEELDRLNLVLQAPNGGLVDERPLALGEHVVRCLAMEELEAAGGAASRRVPQSRRWNLLQNGKVTVQDAERIIRRYLEEELLLEFTGLNTTVVAMLPT